MKLFITTILCAAYAAIGMGQATVTWTLDLNGEAPSADGIFLVGSFNDWTIGVDQLVQSDLNPNYYHITKELPAGLNEYKFVNGLTWDGVEPVAAACAAGPNGHRWVEVQPDDTAFELSFCWGRCASCQLTSVLFRVDMGETPIHPAGVHVAGDFQGWQGNTTPMADADGDGIWEALYSFDVAWLGLENETHFKFLNGDTWDTAEWIEGECGDGNGNRSLLLDSGTDIVVGVGPQSADANMVPCFGECGACAPATVTFRADVSGLDPASVGPISIGGPWNGWNQFETYLAPTGENGIWEVTLELTRNTTHSFKFANGGSYEFQGIDFECDIFDGSTYHNRFVTTGGVGSSVVYTGCFDNCDGSTEPHLNCAGECLMDTDGDGICDPFDVNECTDEAACNTGDWVYGDSPCIYPLVAGDCAAGAAACGEGLIWNESSQTCEIALAMDGNFDGCVGTSDLLMMLGQFGGCLE